MILRMHDSYSIFKISYRKSGWITFVHFDVVRRQIFLALAPVRIWSSIHRSLIIFTSPSVSVASRQELTHKGSLAAFVRLCLVLYALRTWPLRSSIPHPLRGIT